MRYIEEDWIVTTGIPKSRIGGMNPSDTHSWVQLEHKDLDIIIRLEERVSQIKLKEKIIKIIRQI